MAAADTALTYRSLGGVRQAVIRSEEDLRKVAALPSTDWVATSAPISGLGPALRFLDLVDTNRDGRIRVDELREAIEWTLARLRRFDGLQAGSATLELDVIDSAVPAGEALVETARALPLEADGQERTSVTTADIDAARALLAKQGFNGDGTVLPDAASDPAQQQLMRDCMATVGAAADQAGAQGIASAQLEQLRKEAAAWLAWKEQAPRAPEGVGLASPEVLTRVAQSGHDAFVALRPALDRYFLLCRVARSDPSICTWEGLRTALAPGGKAATLEDDLEHLPLAVPDPAGRLDLAAVDNPLFEEKAAAFVREVLAPLTERTADAPEHPLEEPTWRQIEAVFAGRDQWLAQRPDTRVGELGDERLRAALDPELRAAVEALFVRDREVSDELKRLEALERLILYQAHLLELVNNFVCFSQLYDPDEPALFQVGTLTMDGRSFRFAVRVEDRKQHTAVAKNSGICLLYVELTGGPGKPFEVAVAVTRGALGNLHVGKRGVFRDRYGEQWDARCVALVENPVSLWEAVKRPYVKLGRYLTGKLESIATAREKELEKSVDAELARIGKVKAELPPTMGKDIAKPAAKTTPSPSPTPTAVAAKPAGGAAGVARDFVMGGSVAIAALASAFAFVTKTLSETPAAHLIAGLTVGVLVVTVPNLVSSFVRLRRRNLSAILEGSGWAVNARMRLTGGLARLFTDARARLDG